MRPPSFLSSNSSSRCSFRFSICPRSRARSRSSACVPLASAESTRSFDWPTLATLDASQLASTSFPIRTVRAAIAIPTGPPKAPITVPNVRPASEAAPCAAARRPVAAVAAVCAAVDAVVAAAMDACTPACCRPRVASSVSNAACRAWAAVSVCVPSRTRARAMLCAPAARAAAICASACAMVARVAFILATTSARATTMASWVVCSVAIWAACATTSPRARAALASSSAR